MEQRPIVIDGRTYNSVNEMPPEVRAKYEKAMSMTRSAKPNGTTSGFETTSSSQVLSSAMKFIVDGKEFNSLEDLPPEARAKYEQAMGALDKNQNGMPDILEGMMGIMSQAGAAQNAPAMTSHRPASPKPQPASPAISPDTSNGWMLALAGGFLLLLCAAGMFGVWYFFIR
jgi:hypothetical protein